MLKWTVVKVCRGEGLSEAAPGSSQIAEAAPDRTMCSKASRVRNDWGGLISKKATHPNLEKQWPPWALTFVREEWFIVTTPRTRHGPCSVRGWVLGRVPPALGITEKMLPPWSDGTLGTSAEYPEEAVTVLQVERRC